MDIKNIKNFTVTDTKVEYESEKECELAEIREALADGAIYRAEPDRAKALGERLPLAEAELDAAVERWAELAEREG